MSQFVECKGLEAILRASINTGGYGSGVSGGYGGVSGSGNVRMSRVYAEQEMVVCLLQVRPLSALPPHLLSHYFLPPPLFLYLYVFFHFGLILSFVCLFFFSLSFLVLFPYNRYPPT